MLPRTHFFFLFLLGCEPPTANDKTTADATHSEGTSDGGETSDGEDGSDDGGSDGSVDTGETDPPPEDCTNGIDDDLDGLLDCEDDDCADACVEDCSNGIDDDLDGLLDCEDADCAGSEACTEACSGGIDEDGDGLVDCEDGDCWGIDDCPEGEIWVTSGHAAHSRWISHTSRSYTYINAYGSTCFVFAGHSAASMDTFVVTDLQGQVRLPTQAGGLQSCDWSVNKASFDRYWLNNSDFSHARYFETERRNLVSRSGFTIDSACDQVGSDTLPISVTPNNQLQWQALWPSYELKTFYPVDVRRSYSHSTDTTSFFGPYTTWRTSASFQTSASFGVGPRVQLPAP